jgi:hypothetical protein
MDSFTLDFHILSANQHEHKPAQQADKNPTLPSLIFDSLLQITFHIDWVFRYSGENKPTQTESHKNGFLFKLCKEVSLLL